MKERLYLPKVEEREIKQGNICLPKNMNYQLHLVLLSLE
jgi:hypothetical protein